MKVKVYTDGASRGNPGSAAVGIVIKDEGDKVIRTFGKYIGECTNNVAEYTALIEGVKLLKELNESESFYRRSIKGESRLSSCGNCNK